ncbi:hypothetical protein [Euzebya pacifica]|uniref:hypothetical protein n=1 Tax=Euzebya pacifica TaxID=1608957 RepID=UPI0013DF790D|nr:hypothetical protein [Euzebya pacifica]
MITEQHTPADRQAWLLGLLDDLKRTGTDFVVASMLDDYVIQGRACWLLKHDVHALPLQSAVDLARREADMEVPTTWLFMVRDDPLTRKSYSADAQVEAMLAVQELGHQVGLHVDPYHWVSWSGRRLEDLLCDELEGLRAAGLDLTVGTTHGNAAHRHSDMDGYGSAFDLFKELGRQPDFPVLGRLQPSSAALIRENRVSLRRHGFTHWVDMPAWSQHHGFVVTNYVSDNRVGLEGTVEVLVHPRTAHGYVLADHQPPGSRSVPTPRSFISTDPEAPPAAGNHALPLLGETLHERLIGLWNTPTLALLHPQFYV